MLQGLQVQHSDSFFSGYDLGRNYGYDGSPYRSYIIDIDISDTTAAAEVLSKNVTITIKYYYDGRLQQTYTRDNIKFYTENWIKG